MLSYKSLRLSQYKRQNHSPDNFIDNPEVTHGYARS